MSDGLGGFGGDAAASDPDGGSTDDRGLSDYDPPDPDPPSGGSSGGSSSGGSSSRDRDDDDPPDGYFNDAPANDPDGGSTDAGGVGGGTRGPEGAYGDAPAAEPPTVTERIDAVVDTVRSGASDTVDDVSSRIDLGFERADAVESGVGSVIDAPGGFLGDVDAPADGTPGTAPDPARFDPDATGPDLSEEALAERGRDYEQEVAAPLAESYAENSAISEFDRLLPGNRAERASQAVAFGGVNAITNVGQNAAGVMATADRIARDTRRANEQGAAGRRQNRQELIGDATTAAVAYGGAVRDDPVGTLGRTTGALLGGAAVGSAGVRGAPRLASRSGGSSAGTRFDGVSSAVDFEDFRSDTRGLLGGGGRRRSDADQEIEQETIEVERMADEDVVDDTTRELEDIPGVSVQNRDTTSQRTRDAVTDDRTVEELEQDIFDILDDDLLDDTQATTTQSAVDAATVGGVSPFAVGAAAGDTRDGMGALVPATDPDALVGAEGFYGDAAVADGVTADADTDADTDAGLVTGVDQPVLEQTLLQERAVVDDATTPATATSTIGDTTGDTTTATDQQLQPVEITGLDLGGRRTRLRPRPDDDNLVDDDPLVSPLGAESADFLNSTVGLDGADDSIVGTLDAVGDRVTDAGDPDDFVGL